MVGLERRARLSGLRKLEFFNANQLRLGDSFRAPRSLFDATRTTRGFGGIPYCVVTNSAAPV